MKSIKSILFFITIAMNGFSQGGIDHIRNQAYMKNAKVVDCNNPDGDNLSGVICSNLKYQQSDSLLTIVYNKLLAAEETDSARNYIIQLQKEWRAFRDKHCAIVWDRYKSGVGFSKSIAYLQCLAEITDHRRKELESLLED